MTYAKAELFDRHSGDLEPEGRGLVIAGLTLIIYKILYCIISIEMQ